MNHSSIITRTGVYTVRACRLKGPGYWARIYQNGKFIDAVRRVGIYGYETAADARSAGLDRIKTKYT